MNGSDELRRTAALIILHRVDDGERDPMTIADATCRELTGMMKAATE
jgi:hypothetical protein